jgi:nitrate reductase delta subunit
MPNAQADQKPQSVAQVSQPAVSPISESAGRATSCGCAGLETRDTADLEVCATETETPPLLVAQVSKPAVSPVSNRQAPASSEATSPDERPADWESATQQVGNLRYTSAYRFLSEVLLYPEDRDAQRLATSAELAGLAAPELRDAIESMLADPQLNDGDTYLEMFEIGAKCPLYLGHYQFEEPKSCSGAGVSGRNAYMIQLKNLYRHFGFELQARELPDYLPLMLDFLALTAPHPAHKYRRLLVKQFMLPALPAIAKKLREAENVYSHVAAILEQLLNSEVGPTPAPAQEPVTAAADLCNTT